MKFKNPWFLVLMCLGVGVFGGSVFASAEWPNEPAGATVVSEWAFNDFSGNGWFLPWGSSGAIVSDPTAPVSPPNVLKNWRNATGNWSTSVGHVLPSNPREVYAGFAFKPSNPTYGWFNWYQKLATFTQTMGGNFYTKMQPISGNTFSIEVAFENADNSHHSLDAGCLPQNVNPVRFTMGQWCKYEVYAKASSTPTARDGIVAWWCNGQLLGYYNNINTNGNFEQLILTNIWDAVYDVLPYEESVEYDDVHLSLPNNGDPKPVYLVFSASWGSAKVVGRPFTGTLTAEGSPGPYRWSIISGNLQNGLNLDSITGVISGTPTCGGKSSFTVKVVDKSQPSLSAEQALNIVVSGSPVCDPASIETPIQKSNERRQLAVQTVGGNVTFNLPQTSSGNYRVSIYDLAGKNVYDSKAGANGQKELRVEAALKNGIYFAKISQGREMHAVRMSVMK